MGTTAGRIKKHVSRAARRLSLAQPTSLSQRQKSREKTSGKAVVGSLLSVIGDEDTVTGMLLAGIGA